MSDLNAVIADCLDLVAAHGDQGVDMACARHPELADAIRRRISTLRQFGMLDPLPTTPAPLAPPSRLGEFELIERLGAGGMGVVYRATQPSLGRQVAVKVVRPELALFPGSRQRFQREVEAVARLSHPGIVPVYSVGEHADIAYFAMELVEGKTIAELLTDLSGRAPASLRAADAFAVLGGEGDPPTLFSGSWIELSLRVVQHLADALEHAHAAGVVHRDIKPSNVMLTASGRVLLMDFGLATSQDAPGITRTGSQLGSVPYMAPEQIRGEAGAVGPRTDVYALGVLLYEMLTTRPAFHGAVTEDVRRRILAGTPTPIAALHGQVPWDAETVCGTAMDLDPARRYATAAALGRDIAHALAHRPIEARRAGAALRVRRWAQRRPARATAVVLGLLGVVAVPTAVAVVTAGERDAARAAEREATRQAHAANIAATEMSLVAPDAERAKLHLQRARRDSVDFEWGHLALRADQSLGVFRATEWVPHAVEVSPLGDRVLFGDGDQARLFDVASGEQLVALPCTNSAAPCVFGPQGTIAIADREGGLQVYDRDGQQQLHGYHLGTPGLTSLTVVRGTPLVCAAQTNRSSIVWLVDLSSEAPPRQLDAGNSIVALAAGGGADSPRLVVADDALAVALWDLRQLAVAWRVSLSGPSRAVALDTAGERVAVASRDGAIALLAVATGASLRELQPRAGPVAGLAFSPDDQVLATGHHSGAVRLWDTETLALRGTLCGHDSMVEALRFTADGERLWTASADRTIRVWDPAADRHHRVLARPMSGRTLAFAGARDAAFSPDGRHVAVAMADGAVVVWDTRSGARHRTLFRHQRRAEAVAFSADGSRLVSTAADETIVVWSGRDFGFERELACRGRRPTALAVTENGDRVATANPTGTAALWDPATGELVAELERGSAPIRRLSFVGKVLLGRATDGQLTAWRTADGGLLGHADSARELTGVIPGLRPDRVPPVLSDRTHEILRKASTNTAHAASTHRGWDVRAAASADGRRVFTATLDGTIRVWDARGEPLLTLQSEGDSILALAVSTDGSLLLSGSRQGHVQLWRASAAAAERVSSRAAARRRGAQLAADLLEEHVTIAGARAALVDLHEPGALEREHAAQSLAARGDDPGRLVSPGALFLTKASPAQRAANIRNARAAVAIVPTDGFCQGSLGVALYLGEQHSEAVAVFERGFSAEASLRGTNVYHRLFYALALFRLERLDDARAALAEARTLIDVPQEPRYTAARDWLRTFEQRFGK